MIRDVLLSQNDCVRINLYIFFLAQFSEVPSIAAKVLEEEKFAQRSVALDEALSSALVGYIASLLDLISYFRFSSTNRAISNICRTPNKLRQFFARCSYSHDVDYSLVDLSKYPLLESLSISLEVFGKVTLNHPFGANLREIEIYGRPGAEREAGQLALIQSIDRKLLKMNALETLRLSDYTEAREICDVLSRVPMISELDWQLSLIDQSIDYETLQEYLPKLKRLTLSGNGTLFLSFSIIFSYIMHVFDRTRHDDRQFNNKHFESICQQIGIIKFSPFAVAI